MSDIPALPGILGTTKLGAQSILLQTEVICYMVSYQYTVHWRILWGTAETSNTPVQFFFNLM